jgi:hypothetical protein
VKEIFKPLRNYLRQFDRLSFLAAIHSLSNHLEWHRPLPAYLQAANPFNKHDKIFLGFFLWELDTLAREAILHCQSLGGKPVTWENVRKALNGLKAVEDEACKYSNFDIFGELGRIAHRQFHWQQSVRHSDITRYRRIYRQPGMNTLMLNEFGMTAEQFFLGCFGLLATYLNHFAILPEYAQSFEKQLGLSPEPMLTRLSTTFRDLQSKSMEVQSLDIDWAYTFHPLRTHPLIRLDDGRTICPMPGLLARRFTDGLYFDFANNPDNLAKHLGPSFQAYIGDVLTAANQGTFIVLPEAHFGTSNKPKDSVDWIIEDAGAALFLECKVLRLAHAGKASLVPIDREVKKLAKGITQLYATLNDALDGLYPHWQPSGKKIYPTLVTLDNWNLLSHTLQATVKELVVAEFERRQLKIDLLDRYPYSVCYVRELEISIQVMQRIGISSVMSGLTKGAKAGYMVGPYLQTEFPEEMTLVRPLFPTEPQDMIANLT